MKKIKLLVVISIFMSVVLFGCKQECGEGYTGTDCKNEIRSQYYGSYNVVTSCSTSYTITIASSTKGITYVEIGNIDKLGSTVFAQFETSNQNTLVIPQQVSGGNTFQGSFTYTSAFNAANVSYTKTLSGGTILPSCTGTASK